MLILQNPKDDYATQFLSVKPTLADILPQAEIHHIGSTAVPGLGGKGIIDILVAIPDWSEKLSAVEKIKSLGYLHIHPEERERIFMSRVGDTKAGDVHIHLTHIGSSQYQTLLSFRDYLLSHPDKVEEYGDGKVAWLKQAEGDRKIYGRLKSQWIEEQLHSIKFKMLS